MKKNFVLLIFMFFSLTAIYAETIHPRIYLQPPVTEDDKQLKAVSHSVYDTSRLILEMMNQYELMPLESETVTDIPEFSSANNVDSFISGECSRQENGNITIALAVYNREDDSISENEIGTAESVMDVFDLVDIMVVDLLEKFSGRHIAFGNIEFINSGATGEYEIYLDGTLFTPEGNILDNILYGEYQVEIIQDRMEGEYPVKKTKIAVREDETAQFRFSIPGILESEAILLEKEITYINENWEKKRKQDSIEEAFGRLFAKTETSAYSEEIQHRRQEIYDFRQEWEAYLYDISEKIQTRKGMILWELGSGIGYDYFINSMGNTRTYDVPGLDWNGNTDSVTLWDTAPEDFSIPLSTAVSWFYSDSSSIGIKYNFTAPLMNDNIIVLTSADGDVEYETDSGIMGSYTIPIELLFNYEHHYKRFFWKLGAGWRYSHIYEFDETDLLHNALFSNDMWFHSTIIQPGLGLLMNQNGNILYRLFADLSIRYNFMDSLGLINNISSGVFLGFSAGYAFR